jgi:hypothetical protein
MAAAVRRTASETRKPTAQQVVKIARCLPQSTQPRKCATSSELKTTGSFCGFLGSGMSSPRVHFFLGVTMLKEAKRRNSRMYRVGGQLLLVCEIDLKGLNVLGGRRIRRRAKVAYAPTDCTPACLPVMPNESYAHIGITLIWAEMPSTPSTPATGVRAAVQGVPAARLRHRSPSARSADATIKAYARTLARELDLLLVATGRLNGRRPSPPFAPL